MPLYPPQLLASGAAAAHGGPTNGSVPWSPSVDRPVLSVADVAVLGEPLGEFFTRVNASPDAVQQVRHIISSPTPSLPASPNACRTGQCARIAGFRLATSCTCRVKGEAASTQALHCLPCRRQCKMHYRFSTACSTRLWTCPNRRAITANHCQVSRQAAFCGGMKCLALICSSQHMHIDGPY